MLKKFFMLFMCFFPSLLLSQQDLWVQKWVRTYDSGTNETAAGIAVDNNENVYITGSIYNRTNWDFITRKYDPDGNLLWSRKFNKGLNEGANAIALDPNGDVYVTGYLENGGFNDYCTIKYSAAGDTVWTQVNGKAGTNETASAIAVDNNYNIYISGIRRKMMPGPYPFDYFWTIKLNSGRSTLWSMENIGTGCGANPNFSSVKGLALDLNNVYITGKQTYPNCGCNQGFATVKYSSGGTELWKQTYFPGCDSLCSYGITVDQGSNVYITGSEYHNGMGYSSGLTIKYDSGGNFIWSIPRTAGALPSYTNQVFYNIASDNDNNLYVTGYREGMGIYSEKYGSNGTVLSMSYNANGDAGNDIAVSSAGNVYIAGYKNNGKDNDIVVIKYVQIYPEPLWVSATAVSTNKIELVWHNLANETSYTLFRSTTDSTDTAVKISGTGVDMTNYTDTGILEHKNYYYWLKAYYHSRSSPFSSSISIGILITSTITFPLNNSIIDDLKTIQGKVDSPVTVKREELFIQRLTDNKYFNGNAWQAQEAWLTCNGSKEWTYSINNDNKIFNHDTQYKISARGTDTNNAVESGLPEIIFTYVHTLYKSGFCNYPNPFDPNKETTCIEYILSQDNDVSVMILDLNSGKVREWKLNKGAQGGKQGINRIYWDGKNTQGYKVANGIYFCYFTANGQKEMTKIMVIK